MKRKLYTIFLVVLLLLIAVGCGESGGSPASDSSKSGDAETYDYGGATILVKTVTDGAFGVFLDPPDPADENEVQKTMREWRENFEKTYNCKIVAEQIPANQTQEAIIVKLLSGDKFADVINAQRLDFERIRQAGDLLYDWNTISTLDKNNPWLAKDEEIFTYGNRRLAVNTDFYDTLQAGFIVNQRLLKTLNTPDPYELAAQGKWTFDAFFALCRAASKDDGNGKWDLNDQYGLYLSNESDFALYKNAGVKVFTRQPDGTVKYTLDSPEFRAMADLIQKNLVNSHVMLPPTTNINIVLRQFCADKILMLALPDWYCKTILATTDMELGWLPIPLREEGTAYSNYKDGWFGAIMIPKGSKTAEGVGFLVNEYCKLAEKLNALLLETKKNTYYPQTPECWPLIEAAHSRVTYDIYFPEMSATDGCTVPWDIMWHILNGQEYSSTLKSYESMMETFVNEVFN